MDPLTPAMRFFDGWRFPVVAVTLLLGAVAMMTAVLLIPAGDTAAYAFAQEFKKWCFGYDAATGSLEWAYLWMYLVQPVIIAGMLGLVWRRPLSVGWRTRRAAMARWSLGTLGVVVVMGAAMPGLSGADDPADPIEFPGSRIRTSVEAAPFRLVNQDRDEVDLLALRGRVVVVTAVYASCGEACPLIIRQIKSSLAALSEAERADVTVIAITMDPVKDTPAMLSMMADVHDVHAPLYNSVTGDPDYVNAVLDRYGFARRRDPATGVIDHASLVQVLDRNGRIAFRFALGPIQGDWLTESLRLLVSESPSGA